MCTFDVPGNLADKNGYCCLQEVAFVRLFPMQQPMQLLGMTESISWFCMVLVILVNETEADIR